MIQMNYINLKIERNANVNNVRMMGNIILNFLQNWRKDKGRKLDYMGQYRNGSEWDLYRNQVLIGNYFFKQKTEEGSTIVAK